MLEKWDGYPSVTSAQQFSMTCLQEFFLRSKDMAKRLSVGTCSRILEGKTLILIFSEPSTRTSTFLTIAAQNLGANVIDIRDPEHLSSVVKGEPFADMVTVLSRGLQYGSNGEYRGAIAIRHKQEGIACSMAKVSSVPIINAGDGMGQHPTQGLLDIHTIQEIFGGIDNISVAMCGDLEKGRTVRSNSYFLGKGNNVKIFFVSPLCARMKDDIKDYLQRHNVAFFEHTDLRDVAPHVDVIYQTRIQTERGSGFDRNDRSLGYFVVDKTILSLMKQHAIVMHPLPNVGDILPEVYGDPRVVCFREQLDSSIVTKMALLETMLAPAV